MEPFRLVYRAGASCPTEAAFIADVEQSAGPVRSVLDENAARVFVVTLRRDAQHVGRLVVHAPDGSETTREVHAASCADAGHSVALFAALSVRPRASVRASALGRDADPPSDPATVLPEQEHEQASVAVEPLARPVVSGRDDEATGAHLLDRPRWRVGLTASPTETALPGAAFGLAGYLEVQRDAPGAFSPSARLGAEAAGSGSAEIDFARRVLRADACPLRAVVAVRWAKDTLTGAVCGRAEGGVLSASTAAQHPLDAKRPWFAVGSFLQVRWSFPRVYFGFELGLAAPLVRDQFRRALGADPYVVPALGVLGSGAFGVYIW